MTSTPIHSPDDAALAQLCDELAALGASLDKSGDWPREQLQRCARAGVFRWFLPRHWGGDEWSDPDLLRGYLRLGAACLTTAFVITQRTGACTRIERSENDALKRQWLPALAAGETFATVGISHLTTSRRHLAKPALSARAAGGDFVLDGYSPWVTGAAHASLVVTGATLDDGRQILVALPTDARGVSVRPPATLVGLSASHTGAVDLDGVRLGPEWLLAGPAENVMKVGAGANTGGLQTSTLAIALAAAALGHLQGEAIQRADLASAAAELRREHERLEANLLALAAGEAVCTNDELRAAANSLALRASQAALTAAKGSGYVVGHPAGRFCREALFFLVWSCPQQVAAANLCELAGLD